MNTPTVPTSSPIPWRGTIYCLLSAVGYTGANVCLRQLAEIDADPAWVICLKETTAVVVLAPWLIRRTYRRTRLAYDHRALWLLFAAALAVQLVGNLGIQWALGIIGLVISLPMIFGALLIGSALIGVFMFREPLGVRSFVAIMAVIASVVLLSIGATEPASAETSSAGMLYTILAIIVAGVGGTVYAGMGIALRYASKAHIPVPLAVVIVTGTGTLTLGPICLVRLGPGAMLATAPNELLWIVAAGLFNVVAFSFITRGLQLTTLAHANVLNASQVALGTLAGILLFHEPYNAWLLAGVVLTTIGIGTFGAPRKPV